MYLLLLIMICIITVIPNGIMKKYNLELNTVIDMRMIKLNTSVTRPKVAKEEIVYKNQEMLELLGDDVCEILDKYLQ